MQTVALRLIVEREEEINNFKPVEYWTIGARLKSGAGPEFAGKFTGIDGETARVANGVDVDGKEQFLSGALPNEAETNRVVAELNKAAWSVASVERKERKRNPTAPYTTSKLQQDASSRLGFNVRRTMGVAQRLYEGVEIGKDGTVGLITYMRTDSTRVSADSIAEAREYVQKNKKLGAKYLPDSPIEYKGKKGCAGCSRGDSADECGLHARVDQELSERRAVPAVPDDLAEVCVVADGSGGVRSDDD